MASKRGLARKSPDKQKKVKVALELSPSGRGTRLEMETGLEEIDESQKRMLVFIRHLL